MNGKTLFDGMVASDDLCLVARCVQPTGTESKQDKGKSEKQ
jgi:hypothetical protein